jgi:hypothetical protein
MILGCSIKKKPYGGTEATAPTLLGVAKPFGGIPWRWKCWATLLGAHENDAYLNISCSVCHFDFMGF